MLLCLFLNIKMIILIACDVIWQSIDQRLCSMYNYEAFGVVGDLSYINTNKSAAKTFIDLQVTQ